MSLDTLAAARVPRTPRAAPRPGMRTLAEARCESAGQVLTTAYPPFYITHVNLQWARECGFNPAEVIGEACSVLQGPHTDWAAVATLMAALRNK